MSADISSLLPFRCRVFGHRFEVKSMTSNFTSRDLIQRYTTNKTEACRRCGVERVSDHFYSDWYFEARARQREDERLEAVIRRATR